MAAVENKGYRRNNIVPTMADNLPKTPPSTGVRLEVKSTPQHRKLLHSFGSLSGNLEDVRLDILKDLGSIPIVTFRDFVKHVLPLVDFEVNDDFVDQVQSLILKINTNIDDFSPLGSQPMYG
jgi:hypothetical protein